MLVETTRVTEFEYYFACTHKGLLRWQRTSDFVIMAPGTSCSYDTTTTTTTATATATATATTNRRDCCNCLFCAEFQI